MNRLLKKSVLAASIAIATAYAPLASAVSVDLELVLLTDLSGSVEQTDFNLMQLGYVSAFQNATVQNAITSGAYKQIAVTMVYFADNAVQSIGWTLLNSAATANGFASAIINAGRPLSGSTGLTSGLTLASGLFADNGYEGTRQVIDVVGDGSESVVCSYTSMSCVPLQNARNNALNNLGVDAINALWIDDRDFFGDDPADTINALTYGTTNVIGGTGAFQYIAQDFTDFGNAILTKLQREVTGGGDIPEPGSLLLLGAALAGLGWSRRKIHAY